MGKILSPRSANLGLENQGQGLVPKVEIISDFIITYPCEGKKTIYIFKVIQKFVFPV